MVTRSNTHAPRTPHAPDSPRGYTPTELHARAGLRTDVLARLDAPVSASEASADVPPAEILSEFPGFLLDAQPGTLTLLGSLPASRQIRFIEALLAHHAPTRQLRNVGMLPNAVDERGRPVIGEAVWARWESRLAYLRRMRDTVGDVAVAHGV